MWENHSSGEEFDHLVAEMLDRLAARDFEDIPRIIIRAKTIPQKQKLDAETAAHRFMCPLGLHSLSPLDYGYVAMLRNGEWYFGFYVDRDGERLWF
jgi:hypothetical protein